MKKILTILFTVLSCAVMAQKPVQTLGNKGNIVKVLGELGADSAILFPKDTIQLLSTDRAIAFKGTNVYQWDGAKWGLISGASGVSGSILNDSTFLLCNSNGCDTFTVQNITITSFTFTSDSTVSVCNSSGACDTISFPPVPLNKFYVDSTKILSGSVDTLVYYINGVRYIGGFINHFVSPSDGLISGGIVSWSGSGLTFDITSAVFRKFGVWYNTNDTTITLNTPDLTYSRIDLFALDTSNGGEVIKITGTPSPTPVAPQTQDFQITLTTGITLNVGDTVPSNVSIQKIYDENIEWATSTDRATVDFNNTTFPYTGSKDAFVSSYANIGRLVFTRSGNGVIDGSEVLRFRISLNSPLRTKHLYIGFFHGPGTTLSSNIINIGANNGLDPNKVNQYQSIAIPISYFQFTDNSYNRIILYISDYDTSFVVPFYLDNMQLQSGVNNIPQQTDFSKKVDSVVTRNDSLFYVINKNYYWTGYKGSGSGVDSTALYSVNQATDSLSFGLSDLKGNKHNVVILADGFTDGTGIQSIQPGTNITVDNTDPLNPIVNAAFNAYTKPQTDSIAALKANLSHTHPASDIVSGIMNTARLGTGTTNSSTVLFGDNVWRTYNGLIVDVPNVNTSTHVHSYYASVSQTTSFGFSNLQQLRIGGGNTSFGETGLYQLDSGNTNTSIGLASLPSLLDGSNNLGLGYWSYPNLKHGNYNIGIGTFNNDEGDTTLNNTLWISKNTNHMHYELDSASGTAPSIIGKDANGYWHVYQTPTGGGSYTLPTASSTILGGVKVGSGLAIDGSGVLSATGGTGSTYTASNGLSAVGNDIQLGGDLTANTLITNSGFDFTVQRNDGFAAIRGVNLSSGQGIFGSSVGDAIYGTSTNSSGVVGASTSGNGIVGRSTSGLGGFFQISSTSNTTVSSVVGINNNGSDGTSAGFGSSLDFNLRNDGSDIRLSNKLISKWVDATDATRTSEFSITGVNSATTQTLLKISGAGVFTLVQGLTNYTNNAAAITGGLTVGQLYRNGDIVQIVH